MTAKEQWQSQVENSPAHAEAFYFMETASASAESGVDYEWVHDYSDKLYTRICDNDSAFDEKADSIIKYFGGGAGLFALGAIAKIDSANWHIVLAAFPAFVLAVISIWHAAAVRKPYLVPYLPAVKSAKQYADGFATKRDSIGAFLGQWHLACENIIIISNLKAASIRKATICYFYAIAGLSVPLIVAVAPFLWKLFRS